MYKLIYLLYFFMWHFESQGGSICVAFCDAIPLSANTVYTVSEKNDTDIAHYNFDADQPILIIFDRDVAERVCYQMVICYPTSHNQCLCTTLGNMNARNCVFSVLLYSVSKTKWLGEK